MKGKLRWFTHAQRDEIQEKIRTVAKYISETHGCIANVHFHDNCEPLSNPEEVTKSVTNAIIEEFTKDGINDHVGLPLFVSDDFSQYLQKVPGALVLLNTTSLD